MRQIHFARRKILIAFAAMNTPATHILAIDDDRTVLRLVEKAFAETNVKITTGSTADKRFLTDRQL